MMILIRNQQRHRPLNKARIQRTARTILSLLDQSAAELSIFAFGIYVMMLFFLIILPKVGESTQVNVNLPANEFLKFSNGDLIITG